MTIAIAPIEFLGSHSFASCKEQAEKLLCHLADGRKKYNDGANAIQGFGKGRRLGCDAREKYGLRVEKLGWTAGQDPAMAICHYIMV